MRLKSRLVSTVVVDRVSTVTGPSHGAVQQYHTSLITTSGASQPGPPPGVSVIGPLLSKGKSPSPLIISASPHSSARGAVRDPPAVSGIDAAAGRKCVELESKTSRPLDPA